MNTNTAWTIRLDKGRQRYQTHDTHSVEWSLTGDSPSAGVSNCQTHASICGAPIRSTHHPLAAMQNISRTPHSCARPRRVLLWMGLPAEGRSGGCRDLDRHEFCQKELNFRCVNGHCESTSKNIGRSDGLKHNSLDGSWGSWSRYQPNSCGGQIQFVDILGCGKSALDTSGGAAVPAHAGLGSASEVVLATTPDQPMEARLGVGQCACSFRSGVSRQERGVQTLQHQPVHQRYHRHLEK